MKDINGLCKKYSLVGLIVLFVLATLSNYFYPNSSVGKMVTYCNQVSSLIIVLLTLMYVITTNKQLQSMKEQLSVMDSSVKLQIQPLPVPSISDINLEKITAYRAPETNFEKIHILSRFHFGVDFKNAGTGAALNITFFPSILIKSRENKEKNIEIPQGGTSQIHLICEDEKQVKEFMILDNNFEIFKSLSNRDNVTLKLKIYYKNIFGSGFLEEAAYSLRFKDNQKEIIESWGKFLEEGINDLNEDIIRFESLVKKLPKEAKENFKKINDKLSKTFDKDITLTYWINSSSFSVEIVDFEKALETERINHSSLIKTYDPGLFQLIENIKNNTTA